MRHAAAVVAFALAVLASQGQIRLPGGIRLPDRLPSLPDLARGPALDSNINTVPVKGWPEFDDVEFPQYRTLTDADRGQDQQFHLMPGRYQLDLQTFCARGYTASPTAGDGFVMGAWRGSRATLIRDIMRRYTAANGRVSQADTQLLVWAVLARVRPQDMNGGARRAMVQLLGDQGPALLADGAVAYLTGAASRRFFSGLEAPLRPVLDYENRLRGMYADASNTYEDFERASMLPPDTRTPTLVPGTRWNLHPGGYLVRFNSHTYARSRMQVVVPGRPTVTRDALGRVTRIAIDDYALSIGYADSPREAYPGDPGMVAHTVRHIRIDVPAERGGVLEREVDDWVFTGIPARRAPRAGAARGRHGDVGPAAFTRTRQFWRRWQERYERAREARDRIETYEEWWERTERIRRGERPDGDIFDAGHVRDLIGSIFGGPEERLEQIGETHGRMAEWLAHATREIDSLPIDPTDAPYAPGRSGGQTITSSGLLSP